MMQKWTRSSPEFVEATVEAVAKQTKFSGQKLPRTGGKGGKTPQKSNVNKLKQVSTKTKVGKISNKKSNDPSASGSCQIARSMDLDLGDDMNNQSENELNVDKPNDGIMVTVHAPDNDDFGETIEGQDNSVISEDNSDDDKDNQSDAGPYSQNDSFGSVQIRPLSPSHEEREDAEMVEQCKSNPYFMSMVVDMVNDTLKAEGNSSNQGKSHRLETDKNNSSQVQSTSTPARPYPIQ